MPASDVKFGISRHEGALIDSVETDDSVQIKELAGSDGEIARVNAWRASALLQTRSALCIDAGASTPYRKMTEGSVKGHGALAVVPGVGDPGVSGLPNGGVTVITNVTGRVGVPPAGRGVLASTIERKKTFSRETRAQSSCVFRGMRNTAGEDAHPTPASCAPR